MKLLLYGPKKSLSEKLDVLDLPEVYLWLMCPKLKKHPETCAITFTDTHTQRPTHRHPHTDTHTRADIHAIGKLRK